jgi:hypothetical protein
MNGPEIVKLATDIATAVDLLARADPSRSALPNRVLYELSAEFADAAGGKETHLGTDFNAAILFASFNLVRQFNSVGHWDNWHGPAFLRTIDSHLNAAGATFTPQTERWQAVRAAP